MKIPADLISTLLDESPSFRAYAAEVLGEPKPSNLRTEAELIVRSHHDNKIRAIKTLKDFAVEKGTLSLAEAFPMVEIDSSLTPTTLGLGNAKRIVQYILGY
jgi:ribosomal protein L7/L12